jgi:hypothetical protein
MTAAVAEAEVDTTAVADGNTVVETETPVDLSKFNDAVSDAISDGAPSKDDVKSVRQAYGELEPRRGKSAARARLDDDIREAVESGNVLGAQSLYALKDAIAKSGGLKGGRTAAAPKNPTEAQVARVLAIQLGYALAFTIVPEGVDPDWKDQVKADSTLEAQAKEYRTWLENGQEGEEPSVPESAKAGARISLGRAPKGQGRKPKKDGDTAAEAAPAASPLADSADDAPEGWEG